MTKHRGCKEAATKYYNYTVNKADEEREHRLPMFQQNSFNRIRNELRRGIIERQVYSQNYPFFDATIGLGSKNYTICKIDMKSIFPTDWGQPVSLFTVLQ